MELELGRHMEALPINTNEHCMVGNTELLETNQSRHEVFPGRRESYGKVASKLHTGLSRGRLHC